MSLTQSPFLLHQRALKNTEVNTHVKSVDGNKIRAFVQNTMEQEDEQGGKAIIKKTKED